ncbi:MAG: dihydrodipicolinate reductase C-terminal domain-containing protein [Paludibacter sp.]|nr:dihydrodipicolinate reductase C-terminal domain-containing protein [Paludibacter sp.]
MKVGLIGFGQTGRAVATVILQHPDFELEWVLRRSNKQAGRTVSEVLEVDNCDSNGTVISMNSVSIDNLLDEKRVDCIIDFSSEDGIFEYGRQAAKRGIRIVSAVSHYEEKQLSFLKQLAEKTVVFWSPNITLGVNYLIFAAKFLKNIAPFVDIEIIEEHFKQKHGVSGTALKMAEALGLKQNKINSVRAGGIVGKHQVIFGFKYQTIRLTHESISREAFGNGVVFVAENLAGKPSGYYTYEDILKPFLNERTPN